MQREHGRPDDSMNRTIPPAGTQGFSQGPAPAGNNGQIPRQAPGGEARAAPDEQAVL
ncbi:MAG: hypothetical protein AMXMBFR83_22430 [Phycisphaerae bacterium]